MAAAPATIETTPPPATPFMPSEVPLARRAARCSGGASSAPRKARERMTLRESTVKSYPNCAGVLLG